MNKEWSLDVLYKGFQDESFNSDLKSLEGLIHSFKDYVKDLNASNSNKEICNLINYMEEIYLISNKLSDYISLCQSEILKTAKLFSLCKS